jgi:hypothetical protein
MEREPEKLAPRLSTLLTNFALRGWREQRPADDVRRERDCGSVRREREHEAAGPRREA